MFIKHRSCWTATAFCDHPERYWVMKVSSELTDLQNPNPIKDLFSNSPSELTISGAFRVFASSVSTWALPWTHQKFTAPPDPLLNWTVLCVLFLLIFVTLTYTKALKKIKKKWLNEKDKVNFKIYDIQPS